MVHYHAKITYADDSEGTVVIEDGIVTLNNLVGANATSIREMLNIVTSIADWLGSNGGKTIEVEEVV